MQLSLRIAARDETNYVDDQIWGLALGQGDEAAISINTKYGGRVGLARLVPMIQIGNRSIFEKQAFASTVQISSIAPDAIQLQVDVVRGLKMKILFRALTSQVMGGHMVFENQGDETLTFDAQMYLQAMRDHQEVPVTEMILELPKGIHTNGLMMEGLPNFSPVLTMTDAQATGTAKLSCPVTLAPNEKKTVRFIHAALPKLNDSVNLAFNHLVAKWGEELQTLNQEMAQLPTIDTANDALDAAIALSQTVALQSMIGATNSLPYASPIFTRTPDHGFSVRGDGSDHARGWGGQVGLDTFLLALNLLPLKPEYSKGIVRNYLATQAPDGWIDCEVGAGGQRGGELLPPLLAQLTETIYRHTDDRDFVAEVYTGLVNFYLRWFRQDADEDGFPEWRTVDQAYQNYHPTFINFDALNFLETPDLAAYLLGEGHALTRLAEVVRKKVEWKAKLDQLSKALQASWQDGRFHYRDRDTHQPLIGQTVFKGKGEARPPQAITLSAPSRLEIQVESGTGRHPNVTVMIRGLDRDGKSTKETRQAPQFTWGRSFGTVLTDTIWSKIDDIEVQGLSRVYGYAVNTLDLSQHDITHVLPYITSDINAEQSEKLLEQIQQVYLGEYGLASLPLVDAEKIEAGQRVIPIWNVMLGLALLRRGERQASYDLFERVTNAHLKSFVEQGHIYQWYNVQSGAGMGQPDYATGMIPLYWLMQLIGVWVRDAQTVEILGELAFKRKVNLEWQGVKISRSNRQTKIKFPNGQEVTLLPDAEPQLIRA